MKRFVSAFAVPLTLALGLVQGNGSLPSAAPRVLVPVKPGKQAPLHYQLRRSIPPVDGLGDGIPHSYTVYGLRTGPGGMAFTDRNGAVLPVPSDSHIITGPFIGLPIRPALNIPPGAHVMPYSAPRSVPKR